MPRSFGSGITGSGFMGRLHAAAVRAAGGRVVAVCGSRHPDPEEVRLISQTVTVPARVAVDGTGGSLMFDREDPDHLWRGNGAGWERLARGVRPVRGFGPPEGLPSFEGGLRPAPLIEAVVGKDRKLS